MQICHRSFSGGYQITLSECFSIKPFLNRVSLIQKFWELTNSLHAFSLNHEWWAYLSVTVFVYVQIQ